MQKIKQVLFTFLTFVAAFYFSFWISAGLLYIPFSTDTDDPSIGFLVITGIVSFGLAIYLAYKVWKKNGKNKHLKPTSSTYILSGALGLGVFGFLAGFIGPLIFMPEANQGPLLGILITGPGGVALGALGGLVAWEIKRVKSKKLIKKG